MTGDEYKYRLNKLIFTCAMNQKYHRQCEWWYGTADKIIRIAVGVLAVIGLVVGLAGKDYTTLGIWLAVFSLIVAFALNVFPVGDREKFHSSFFRLWSDLRKDAANEEHKTCELDDDANAPPQRCERLADLWGKAESLNSGEPAAWPNLLIQCQEDARRELGQDGHCQPATCPPSAASAAAGAAD
jgi:hypothetical protein